MNDEQVQMTRSRPPFVPDNALLINFGWNGLFGEDRYPLVQSKCRHH